MSLSLFCIWSKLCFIFGAWKQS